MTVATVICSYCQKVLGTKEVEVPEGMPAETHGVCPECRAGLMVEAKVMRAKREILADIESGEVPAEVSDFAELHEYVDANEYGGVSADDLIETNAVQAALDRWLIGGRP